WTRANQEKLVIEGGFPTAFDAQVQVGHLVLRSADLLVLGVVPVLALGLAAFFRYTSYGQAIRAASENPDAARLAGISVRRMSTMVWAIGGVLAASTGIMQGPRISSLQVDTFGPGLLVRALAAGLIGRMNSLPLTFAGGVGIGIVEAVIFANRTEGGLTELAIFAIIMAALLVRARELSRATRDASAGVAFGAEARAVPRRLAALPAVRRLRTIPVVAVALLAVALPYLPILELDTSAKTFRFTLMLAWAVVGLSLCVLTGWAGQVSLGQVALVGAGSFGAVRLQEAGLPWPLVIVGAGLLGVGLAVVVGLPAVRIQGLFLAVSTLAFAVLATSYLFQQKALVGDASGVFLDRPAFLHSERSLYHLALGMVALFALVVRNFRASGPGRLLVAVRDNDRAARADGVSATGARLVAFALAGFMAACAGVLFAYARQRYTATTFPAGDNYRMLSMVIIGGLGSIPGAILGAVFLFGLPLFIDSRLVDLAVSGLGLLVFLLFAPQGIVGLVYNARDALIERIRRRHEGLPAPPPMIPPLRELWRVALGRPATDG
ncbi:MAG TPA: ABC transporter permease, partial [Acidimicrobiales bacterium]|nr:ABC transporter permease [Acidimicrobiales bacterium]